MLSEWIWMYEWVCVCVCVCKLIAWNAMPSVRQNRCDCPGWLENHSFSIERQNIDGTILGVYVWVRVNVGKRLFVFSFNTHIWELSKAIHAYLSCFSPNSLMTISFTRKVYGQPRQRLSSPLCGCVCGVAKWNGISSLSCVCWRKHSGGIVRELIKVLCW